MITVHHGDCVEILREMPGNSIDSICTDPPYALEFLGAEWDTFKKPANAKFRTRVDGRTNPRNGKSITTTPEAYVAGHPFQQWCEQWATECLRVLKPGGHMTAFGGTRTSHRLACAIEDAGFEIRDAITWLYGSGFPKSLDVSKAIDNAAGAIREVIGENPRAAKTPKHGTVSYGEFNGTDRMLTGPATDAAKQWSGYGTALKPASEPIIVARKALVVGTVAANVLAHGTGALNIDATRVATGEQVQSQRAHRGANFTTELEHDGPRPREYSTQGRWPPNVVISHASTVDGGDACAQDCVEGCPVAELDQQSLAGGIHGAGGKCATRRFDNNHGIFGLGGGTRRLGDSGGASRFFPIFRYQAKAPRSERPVINGVAHPTVKPLALIEWLITLITPPCGTVLDLFAGTGTTGEACQRLGFNAILIERESKYHALIEHRLARAQPALGSM